MWRQAKSRSKKTNDNLAYSCQFMLVICRQTEGRVGRELERDIFILFAVFRLEWKSRSGVADVQNTLAAHVPAIDFFHPHHKTIRSCSLIRQSPHESEAANVLVVHEEKFMRKSLIFRLRPDTEISSDSKTTDCRLTNLLRRHFSSISSTLPFSILQTANLCARRESRKKRNKSKSCEWFLALGGESESDEAFNRYWMSALKCF